MSLPIGIVGGGSFGRALALAAARVGRSVILWSRQDRDFRSSQIRSTDALPDLAESELIFLAVPSPHVESVARELGASLDGSHLVVHVSRGLGGNELQTITELVRRVTPVRRIGALAGPLVASGLAEGHPGGAIVGTLFPEVVEAVREAIAGPTLRIYGTDDVIGVELASAYVGMAGVALGVARAAGFGPGTIAVLATRSMAEAARLGHHRGAEERTFAGLAGTGDLIAAVADDKRPELAVGEALHAGMRLSDAVAQAGAYVEGVGIARQVVEYVRRHGLEAPIAQAIHKLADGQAPQIKVIAELMARPLGTE